MVVRRWIEFFLNSQIHRIQEYLERQACAIERKLAVHDRESKSFVSFHFTSRVVDSRHCHRSHVTRHRLTRARRRRSAKINARLTAEIITTGTASRTDERRISLRIAFSEYARFGIGRTLYRLVTRYYSRRYDNCNFKFLGKSRFV